MIDMPDITLPRDEFVMASRQWFASLIRKAFPADTDHETSMLASDPLGVTPREVRNWLLCKNDARLSSICRLFEILGVSGVIGSDDGETCVITAVETSDQGGRQ